MELNGRYLHQVGKHLPRNGREDILAEIRSHLEDTLDERTAGKPTEDAAVALLKETGSPRKMAESYSSKGSYVIGPALYPLFRMVSGIALAAVIGAQLLALGIGLWADGEMLQPWGALGGILASVPSTIGSIVIVFMILQHYGVQPDLDDNWDPRQLPEIVNETEIKRGEVIFGIAGGSVLLALLAAFSDRIGFFTFPGGEFYPNPVIQQYLPWICASLLLGVGLNIYLLWQGRWNAASRAVQLAADVFAIVVLAFLYQGHSAWLAAHGSTGFLVNIENLASDLENSVQLIGMEAFRMAFGIALVVTTVELIVTLVKWIVKALRGKENGFVAAK